MFFSRSLYCSDQSTMRWSMFKFSYAQIIMHQLYFIKFKGSNFGTCILVGVFWISRSIAIPWLDIFSPLKRFGCEQISEFQPPLTWPSLTGVKKITWLGARNKLNFRRDKHILSLNVWWAGKKFSAAYFSLNN